MTIGPKFVAKYGCQMSHNALTKLPVRLARKPQDIRENLSRTQLFTVLIFGLSIYYNRFIPETDASIKSPLFSSVVHRIKDDRMENSIKGRRIGDNLLL